MGNEDKIRKDLVAGHSRFLPEEIQDLDEKHEVYSLDREYAKTKKNKNFKLYLFVIGFIAVVVGGAYLYTLYLEKKNKDIKVSIKEFEDLRLKEVIDSARKRGSNIDMMRINVQMLEIEMMMKVLDARRDIFKKENDFLAQNPSLEEADRRIAELRNEEQRRVREIEGHYRGMILQQKNEIAAIEAERQKEENAVKGKSDAVTNADRLHEMNVKKLKEKQQSGIEKMRKYYDDSSKFVVQTYNPNFEKGTVGEIVSANAAGVSIIKGEPSRNYDRYYGQAGFGEDDYNKLGNKVKNAGAVLKRLTYVPYQNSVPKALAAVDNLAGGIIQDYEKLATQMAGLLKEKDNALERKNQVIAQWKYPYEYLIQAKKDKAQGYVIDPRNPQKIIIFLPKESAIGEGGMAIVQTPDNKTVGRVAIFKDEDGMVCAKVVSLEKKATLLPNQKLMPYKPKK